MFPWGDLSKHEFAQILPLLLPQFVLFCIFQIKTHQSSFHLSVLLLKL